MRDQLDIQAEPPRTNGRAPTGLGYWEANRIRRQRERRRDLLGLAMLLAATAMGIVIGYMLRVMQGGGS